MSAGLKQVLLVGSVCMLLGLTAMIVLNMVSRNVQHDMEFKCQALQGELVFYECYHAGDWFLEEGDRCTNKMAGYMCELPDGSNVEFYYDVWSGKVKP